MTVQTEQAVESRDKTHMRTQSLHSGNAINFTQIPTKPTVSREGNTRDTIKIDKQTPR